MQQMEKKKYALVSLLACLVLQGANHWRQV